MGTAADRRFPLNPLWNEPHGCGTGFQALRNIVLSLYDEMEPQKAAKHKSKLAVCMSVTLHDDPRRAEWIPS